MKKIIPSLLLMMLVSITSTTLQAKPQTKKTSRTEHLNQARKRGKKQRLIAQNTQKRQGQQNNIGVLIAQQIHKNRLDKMISSAE